MLKSGDNEKIKKHIGRLQSEARATIRELVELAWFMRGSIQYHSLMLMCHAERQIVREFIDNHLEIVKKHPFPVY